MINPFLPLVHVNYGFFHQPWHLYVFIGMILFAWLFLFLYSFIKDGWEKTFRYFLPVMIVGLFVESAGVAMGKYSYPGYFVYISVIGGMVPLIIMFGWGVNLFVFIHLGERIARRVHLEKNWLQILLIAGITGCVGVCFDVLEDPIAHYGRWWVWNAVETSTTLFDVPLSNFGSWFIFLFVMAACTLVIDRARFSEKRKVLLSISSMSVVAGIFLLWKLLIEVFSYIIKIMN